MAVCLLSVTTSTTTSTPFGLCSSPLPVWTSSSAITSSNGRCSLIDSAWGGGLSLSTTTGWEKKLHGSNNNNNSRSRSRCTAAVTEVFASGSGGENWQSNFSGESVGKELNKLGVTGGGRAGRSRLEKWRSEVSVGVEEEVATGGGDDSGNGGAGRGGGGDGSSGGDGGEYEGSANQENKEASLAVLATVGRSLESLPKYLAAAVEQGKIPPAVLERFLDLEKTSFRKWLMQFDGFRERLLADDLFLTKVGIECGVGLFTKTAAEYERRRENFSKELDFVIADVIMALVADFMLVWLPAPTVSLQPALAKNANALLRYFANCPDNAFQVALKGTSYSTLQRVGAIVRNGSKLLVVGTSASFLGTAATNGLIKLRNTVDKSIVEKEKSEEVDVPILETSLAYGVYMAISSNLRYQILAGVVEQRVLEPLLGRRKLALSAASFAVRTGNTFLGSLLWVDYARWVGVQ
ncbi:unnamed protein product [Calypogeia fissa]